MLEPRTVYYRELLSLVMLAQKNMEPTVLKTKAAQKTYFASNRGIYDGDEIETLQYFLDAFLYKFQLANFSLEQLWTIRDAKVAQNLQEIIRNSISTLDLTNNEVFLQSFLLEQFLFQGRSYLDFMMLYIAHFLRTGHEGSMSTKTFYKRLAKENPDALRGKSTQVEHYFKTRVFGAEKEIIITSPTNWGTLIKSLRDKIAHRDRIKISKNSSDRIMNDILLDFPTLKDLTYDTFCQAMQNGMWNTICELLFPILYDLKWQPGPYRNGMFEN